MRRHIILLSLLLVACTAQAVISDGPTGESTVSCDQAIAVNHAKL